MNKEYLVIIYEKNEIVFDKITVPKDLSIKQFEMLKKDPTVKIKEIEDENGL